MEQLKEGMTFEVVEVLENWVSPQLKSLHCIISDMGFVKRTKGDFDLNPNNGYWLIPDFEIKKIGRLKITKVK